ncbi:MAG TPA: M23 family metallopeptidase [Sinomonas sp.]|nr:M23 family metallopeptidase [Sinomonas sp.]
MFAAFAGPRLVAPLVVLLPWLFGVIPLAGAASSTGWEWPLSPRPAVVRAFDPPEKPWLSGHRGVDLASGAGQEIRSPAPGTVVFAAWVVDRPVVTVDHGKGLRSSFEPVETALKSGDRVAAGQAVGRLWNGGSHCRAGPCVHWGVRDSDDYVDPLRFVADTRPSVLLPWHG